MRLHPCQHDSCPEWVGVGHGAHDDTDDPDTWWCERHCPDCNDHDEDNAG
jgi:hypothetical protein